MINVSEAAKEKLFNVLIEEHKTLVRFGLQGGGCSGFQYYFAMEDTKADDDLEIDIGQGHTLLVDSMSMMYLENASIDYKQDFMQEGFVFDNPNAQTSCGCGSSFSV
jgi:iron-sulfur cluster insertion protein